MKKLIGPAVAACALAVGACAQDQGMRFASDDVYTNAGYNQLLSGDLAAAEQNLLQAVRTDPNNASALLSLGALYEGTGRAQQAAQIYQQVAGMNTQEAPSVTYPAEMQGRSYPEIAQAALQRVQSTPTVPVVPVVPMTTPGTTPQTPAR